MQKNVATLLLVGQNTALPPIQLNLLARLLSLGLMPRDGVCVSVLAKLNPINRVLHPLRRIEALGVTLSFAFFVTSSCTHGLKCRLNVQVDIW